MLYDYLAWMAGYNTTPVEEPTELKEPPKVEEPTPPPPSPEKKEEVNPHIFPSANFIQPEPVINIAQLETEQENIVAVHSYLIYPKRNKRQRS